MTCYSTKGDDRGDSSLRRGLRPSSQYHKKRPIGWEGIWGREAEIDELRLGHQSQHRTQASAHHPGHCVLNEGSVRPYEEVMNAGGGAWAEGCQ